MHVLFELRYGLCGEGVRDRLALAGVLSAVSCVEQSSLDGHEDIIVFTTRDQLPFIVLVVLGALTPSRIHFRGRRWRG